MVSAQCSTEFKLPIFYRITRNTDLGTTLYTNEEPLHQGKCSMNQNEAVIITLEKLGGIATLGQLNQEVFKIKECVWKTKTPFASIRRIVQQHKEIYKIKPGLYGLKKLQVQHEQDGIISETEKNKQTKEMQIFNHSYYQGLIITIGNLKQFSTFVPQQDKNKKFINQKLSDIRTLDTIPAFSYKNLVHRSSTIDVIWFNERNMPHSFFEIEHTTDMQNSLLKFNDLQDFYTRMIIVSDKYRKNEFETKLKYTSFSEIAKNKRVAFLDYDTLIKQYEKAIEGTTYGVIL